MLDKFFACEYLEKDKSAFNGFKFEGIQYGWLGIGFYKDGQGIGLDFDECLYDPIPEMIKMCLKLKMNENFSFVLPDIGRGMSVEILSDGKVKFILYEGWEKEEIIYEQIFERSYCIRLLEDTFNDLLSCEYYPKMYPLFSDLNDDEYARRDDEAEEYCKINGIEDFDEQEIYKKKLVNEKVNLYDYALPVFDKYDLMLRKHIIPADW